MMTGETKLCVACGDDYVAERGYDGYYCEDCRPPDTFTDS